MATANVVGNSADGFLYKSHASVWASCIAATPSVSAAGTDGWCRRAWTGAEFSLRRSYWYFDLSPYAGDTITAATLKIYCKGVTNTRVCSFYYKDWGGTLAAADWTADLGTLPVAIQSYNSASTGLKSIDLINISNLQAVNGMLEAALDDEATEPSAENSVNWGSATYSTAVSIDITYTPAAGGLVIPVAMNSYRQRRA